MNPIFVGRKPCPVRVPTSHCGAPEVGTQRVLRTHRAASVKVPKAPEAASIDLRLAVDELRGLCVLHLAQLPVRTALVLRVPGLAQPVGLVTSRALGVGASQAGAVVLGPVEYEVLAHALTDGRLGPARALRALAAKARKPACRLTREALTPGVVCFDGDAGTFGAFFDRLAADPVSVQMEAT